MGRHYTIGIIEGDGIGPELMPWAIKILGRVARICNFSLRFLPLEAGARCYLKTGEVLPEKSLRMCMEEMDIILKAPVGLPELRPGLVERDMLLKLRQEMDLYINLRPIRLFNPLLRVSPLKEDRLKEGIDITFVRENSEGLYSKQGGASKEVATDINIYTLQGVERVIRYAFELAKRDGLRKVTSVDKANILNTSRFWRERFEVISADYPGIESESIYVDAMAQYLIRCPHRFEVVVTDNIFGDILTDEASEVTGSLGLGYSGNINPKGKSMFEPISGSAPDIAGKGLANPIGQILSGMLLLEHVGEKEAALLIENATIRALEDGLRTKDLAKGNEVYVNTSDMGKGILKRLDSK